LATDWHSRTSAGNQFQTDGATTEEAHQAISVLVQKAVCSAILALKMTTGDDYLVLAGRGGGTTTRWNIVARTTRQLTLHRFVSISTVPLTIHRWHRLQPHYQSITHTSVTEVWVPQARVCGSACHCTYDKTWTMRVSSINWKHFCLEI